MAIGRTTLESRTLVAGQQVDVYTDATGAVVVSITRDPAGGGEGGPDLRVYVDDEKILDA